MRFSDLPQSPDNSMTIPILQCPVCKSHLFKYSQVLQCNNNHSFDIAKQGYINLLLTKHKSSKKPGDSKSMLLSRKSFLNTGYYNKLSVKLNIIIEDLIKQNKTYNNSYRILDIGCGEGYYLTELRKYFIDKSHAFFYGVDISKNAIKLAASRERNINWIVASLTNLPFMYGSMDYIISMFSTVNFDECNRILNNEGNIIFVSAGINHLQELREIIYPNVFNKESVIKEEIRLSDIFNIYKKYNLSYSTTLISSIDIQNLLNMTPHFWKVTSERKITLKYFNSLQITVDVDIYILNKIISH